MKKNLQGLHGEIIRKMVNNSDPNLNSVITPKNVYQNAQKKNRTLLKEIIDNYLTYDSEIIGLENLIKLAKLSSSGKSTLVLSGHYSNFDVPSFYILMIRENDVCAEIFDRIVFIAGRKLNEQAANVKVFSEMFNRIVIVAKDPDMSSKERLSAFRINLAAQRKIQQLKHEGFIFLIYPTGTRVRPWDPNTYKGLPEIFNYLNNFEYMIFCGIQGNILPPTKSSFLLHDIPKKDKVIYHFGPIIKTKKYIEQKAKFRGKDNRINKKKWIVDCIMKEIYSLGHNPYEI